VISPTQRSLKLLRDEGWHVEIVEHYNYFTKRRKDLFGFADLLACKSLEPPLLVQVTSGSNHSARRLKIANSPLIKLVLSTGMRVEIHSWRKLKKKRGGKQMIWSPRVEEITVDSLKKKR